MSQKSLEERVSEIENFMGDFTKYHNERVDTAATAAIKGMEIRLEKKYQEFKIRLMELSIDNKLNELLTNFESKIEKRIRTAIGKESIQETITELVEEEGKNIINYIKEIKKLHK